MKNERAIEYKGEKGICLDVMCDGETVWLSQEQMCLLFGRERSVITKHINNVFKEGELPKEGFVQILHKTSEAGGRPSAIYGLDVVISVGYRVKSVEGTRFRQWATRKLREILLARIMDVRRSDKLEDRVETVEQGLSVLANEFSEWTVLPAHKPMGFGVQGKGK